MLRNCITFLFCAILLELNIPKIIPFFHTYANVIRRSEVEKVRGIVMLNNGPSNVSDNVYKFRDQIFV
jgi:hypothetical protein